MTLVPLSIRRVSQVSESQTDRVAQSSPEYLSLQLPLNHPLGLSLSTLSLVCNLNFKSFFCQVIIFLTFKRNKNVFDDECKYFHKRLPGASSFSILFPILFSSLSVIETEIDFSDSCHENDTWILDIEK